MKDNPIMVDTNLLVYAFDTSEPLKREKCKAILEQVSAGEIKAAVSNQILAELYNALTRNIEIPVSADDAATIVSGIIESEKWVKLNYTATTVKAAMQASKMASAKFWDSLIMQTMLENGIAIIYTENSKDFIKFNSLKVVNPLAKGA